MALKAQCGWRVGWLECGPVHQRDVGLIPVRAHTGLRVRSSVGVHMGGNTWMSLSLSLSISLSLSLSLPFSLKSNIFSGEDKNKRFSVI